MKSNKKTIKKLVLGLVIKRHVVLKQQYCNLQGKDLSVSKVS